MGMCLFVCYWLVTLDMLLYFRHAPLLLLAGVSRIRDNYLTSLFIPF
jgi:hypothetical protein